VVLLVTMSDACKLYVGRLSYDTRNEDLMDRFEEFGKVSDATIITDRETGRSRGFGFATFTNEKDAEDVKKQLNESEFMGGPLLFDKRSQDVVGVGVAAAVTEAEVEEDIMMGVTVVDTEAVSFIVL